MSAPGPDSSHDPRETVSMFEWRILALERSTDDNRERVRLVEKKQEVLEERMVGMREKLNQVADNVETLTTDRYKILIGFVATMVTVVATHILWK